MVINVGISTTVAKKGRSPESIIAWRDLGPGPAMSDIIRLQVTTRERCGIARNCNHQSPVKVMCVHTLWMKMLNDWILSFPLFMNEDEAVVITLPGPLAWHLSSTLGHGSAQQSSHCLNQSSLSRICFTRYLSATMAITIIQLEDGLNVIKTEVSLSLVRHRRIVAGARWRHRIKINIFTCIFLIFNVAPHSTSRV